MEVQNNKENKKNKGSISIQFFRWCNCCVYVCNIFQGRFPQIMQQKDSLFSMALLFLPFSLSLSSIFVSPFLQEFSWPQTVLHLFLPRFVFKLFCVLKKEIYLRKKKKSLAIGCGSWTYRRKAFCMEYLVWFYNSSRNAWAASSRNWS